MRLKKIIGPFHNQKRALRSSRPTLILVRNGMVTVRTATGTYCAQTGNSILLAPGSFDIEATPAVRHGNIDVEIASFSLAALGRAFGDGSVVESLVLRIPESENTGVYIQKRIVDLLDRELASVPTFFKNVESIVTRILNTCAASTFRFARFGFFEKRWAFQALLEANVLRPGVVEWLAGHYIDGRAAFFRDCKIFVGMSPAKWIKTRRLELARAWLRHGKASIEDIAKVLAFCNVRALRTALWKHFEMTIDELKDTEGMRLFGIPLVAFRPFWWPSPLPLIGEAQRRRHPADEVSELAESAPEPCEEESPTNDARDLPPEDGGNAEPKPVKERFFSLEMIPVAEIIPFPSGLPVLLKAA
jgi:AraC-like DNA-binding protein